MKVRKLSTDLPDVIEVAVRHPFLSHGLQVLVQQTVQLVFRGQILQAPVRERFPTKRVVNS